MHLTIYFCGSRESSIGFQETNHFHENTLIVSGCVHPEVCNSYLFPNLKKFAERFIKRTFLSKNNTIYLAPGDPTEFSVGIAWSGILDSDKEEPITSITLSGSSRGGVTCFEVARQLQQLAPLIPIDLIADQPVPGNLYQGFNTNARSIADCRSLTNLKSVSIILGTYTDTDLIDQLFLSQIVPKLPPETKREILVTPINYHRRASACIQRQLAQSWSSKSPMPQDCIDRLEEGVKDTYIHKSVVSGMITPIHYPPVKNIRGGFFGIKKEQLYQYTDKSHPTYYLRSGFEWDHQESLIDWWKKHEASASRYSTQLTKDLVKTIQDTNENDVAALITLFKAADRWVILKTGRSSSRHDQVEALRNNIFHRLTTEMSVDRATLFDIHTDLLQKEHYFLNYWTHSSAQASFFKTDATRLLDQAFSNHAKQTISDLELLEELNSWLLEKQTSHSKRYNLVMHIREQLHERISSPLGKMML